MSLMCLGLLYDVHHFRFVWPAELIHRDGSVEQLTDVQQVYMLIVV